MTAAWVILGAMFGVALACDILAARHHLADMAEPPARTVLPTSPTLSDADLDRIIDAAIDAIIDDTVEELIADVRHGGTS